MTEPSVEATYKKVALLVDQWLELHKGETFDLDTICRQLEITQRENRHNVVKKLAYEINRTENPKVEKSNRIYRVLDNTLVRIDWVNAPALEFLDIHWPFGREDNSRFTYDGNVYISSGDLIVVAGVSNMGKTTWCLNFLWENMDAYHCRLIGNEYQANKFRRRVSPMTWAEPINEHGAAKFDLIERYEGWKDAIDPDAVNIIDWISLEDKFYMIGSILQGIRSKLRKGIAVVALQKSAGKDLGMGGGWSEHLASLYLLLDFERMTCRKAKEWNGFNPNGQMDRFCIVAHGSKFHDIQRVIPCSQCHGFAAVKKNTKCACGGRGYVDADSC